MKKTIVALAVAAAFTTPAFADNANVTVYGKALMTMDQKGSNATGAASQIRVNTNASRFGVKGSEDLGEGLKAVYQFELEIDADGSGNSVTTTTTSTSTAVAAGGGTPTITSTSTSTPTPSGLGKSRNSGAGIEGAFGKVMLGIWDTPFKTAHNKIELFDNTTSWTSTAVIGRSAGKDFNTRQKNMIQYWSPKIMESVQVAAMFSPDEAQTTTVNKSILSMAATYDVENIYASVAYESRANVFGTTTDTAFRAVAKYDIADFSIGALAESIKTNLSATAAVTGSNMELVGQYKIGPTHLAVSYAKQGSAAAITAAKNNVDQLSLKYAFNFSKRTELFAAYTSNKTANGTLAAPTSTTLTYLGGGIVHAF
jgi:predicted porin